MTNYVVGFVFNSKCDQVLLIRKNRPSWQKGKYNGIGGHIERGESPTEAMVREFREETGVQTNKDDWENYGHLSNNEFYLHLYSLINDEAFNKADTKTDEKIDRFKLIDLALTSSLSGKFCIPNLSWLIPAALDSRRAPTVYISGEYES